MKLDALIIGGGPAGATTALLLAEAGWSVGLIEKKLFPRRKVCGEFLSATNLPLLEKLGLADYYLSTGGPEVQRIGLYAASTILIAPMPPASSQVKWGRALGRELLDTEIINKAQAAGVHLWQPAEAMALQRKSDQFICSLKKDNEIIEVTAPVVVVANGSWEKRIDAKVNKISKKSDLLAFKAHFKNTSLAPDLMPLLAFPGGYGGLVNTNNQRVTLSCCIRRDTLQDLRRPGLQAAETVCQYIKNQCRGVSEVLFSAQREGEWLATGSIQPGVRNCYKDGLFFVGNIAGEAHPIVAEGISMAMQSAWLLSTFLIKHKSNLLRGKSLNETGAAYTKEWRRQMAKRIYVSAFFAQLAMMSQRTSSLILPVIKQFPAILTLGAKLCGKIKQVVPTVENI
ncbi:MAG: NAD(P)/FAD-dependent oxidoreductase [Tatlockia sp.]|nr:NAD(P)/FAD-dependent oxidoreductase [Tatlockia sp.]